MYFGFRLLMGQNFSSRQGWLDENCINAAARGDGSGGEQWWWWAVIDSVNYLISADITIVQIKHNSFVYFI